MLLVGNPRFSNCPCVELTRESLLLEERLRPITQELNFHSLRVNRQTWQQNLEAAEEQAHLLIDACRELSGDSLFRPNSPADVAKALFKDLKPTDKRPSTDRDSLLTLSWEGMALAGAVIEARSAISRWSQLRAWKPFALSGFVQARWDSNGTPQGRYTAENPCICNRIPSIRATIEPDPGYSFLSLDLGQAEYCVWAGLSKDQFLSRAFLEGRDFHSEMAHAVREAVPAWDLRGEDERQAGKMLNFAILYQMTPPTLARKLNCPIETAAKLIKAYYSRVPQAAAYIRHLLDDAKRLGYVDTRYGRRRYCPELQLQNTDREEHEIEKTLWSHVNSGTSAEYLKFKQLHAWESLRKEGLKSDQVRLSIQLYDECVWHVRNDVLDEVKAIAEDIWRRREPGFLPFRVDVKTGQTWEEASR